MCFVWYLSYFQCYRIKFVEQGYSDILAEVSFLEGFPFVFVIDFCRERVKTELLKTVV